MSITSHYFTWRLTQVDCQQGSGPVHLIGQHLLGALVEEFEDMEEMEEEMLDEEEGDDSQFKVGVIDNIGFEFKVRWGMQPTLQSHLLAPKTHILHSDAVIWSAFEERDRNIDTFAYNDLLLDPV